MTVLIIPDFSSSKAMAAGGSAPVKKSAVTENLLENVPRHLKPIGEMEYAELCIKFSDKLPPKEIPDLLKQCGVNSKKVLFITPQSIIEGAFKDNRERLDYFKEILNSKKKLKEAFRDFVYSTPVSEDDVMRTVSPERTENYRDYVYRAVADGLGVRAYRDRIVSFLAALEYRRTVDPEFQIQFNIFDHIEEKFTEENVLLLRFEYKDGRHYSDLTRAGARLTLPFDFRENAVDFDDTYVCMHEIGHAIHNLLDVNSRAIPLSVSSENAWMRKTFFPLLDKSEKAMPSFIDRAKETLKQCFSKGKSMWDYCSKSLQQANEIYRDEAHPCDKDEFRRMGITKIENMLSDEKNCDNFKKFLRCKRHR